VGEGGKEAGREGLADKERELSEKVPCAECGRPVSATLASGRNGLCLRCSAKRSPCFLLYASLIERVCHSPGGFDELSDAEKLYYALTLFQNEINNGGFHQFFFNSSGSYYDLIENGLASFDEQPTLELLRRAKQIVFQEMAIPSDTKARRHLMTAPSPDLMNNLDELDQQFYRTPNHLSAKLEAFARERGLVSAETVDT
jgi:Domain of unknown function (DUF4375)